MTIDSSFDWPEIGRTVGPHLRPGGAVLTERALDLCDLPPGSRIADIGCGAGGTLEHLERGGLYRLVGVDCSESQLRLAASRLRSARLVRGRAGTLPFGDGVFDALLCECVLSVVDDRNAALGEFARVVTDGGFLVVSDVFSRSGREPPGKSDFTNLLAALGFSLLLWEEHTSVLKEFAARLILAGNPLPCSWGGGIGYFLMVARMSDKGGV